MLEKGKLARRKHRILGRKELRTDFANRRLDNICLLGIILNALNGLFMKNDERHWNFPTVVIRYSYNTYIRHCPMV
jgi:hypothetical protein